MFRDHLEHTPLDLSQPGPSHTDSESNHTEIEASLLYRSRTKLAILKQIQACPIEAEPSQAEAEQSHTEAGPNHPAAAQAIPKQKENIGTTDKEGG